MERRKNRKRLLGGVLATGLAGIAVDATLQSGEAKSPDHIDHERTNDIQPASQDHSFLREMRPNDGMLPGFSRYEIHAKNEHGDTRLIGSFLAIDGNEAEVSFLSRRADPGLFVHGVDFNAVADRLRQQGRTVVLIAAGAFTPDYQQIEGMAFENGIEVGQKDPAHGGILLIKDGRAEIVFTDQISNLDSFKEQAAHNKWSFFQQIPVIRDGQISFNTKNTRQYETRFFVERETPAGITRGVVNFTEAMTIPDAIQALKNLQSKESRIKNALYLDTGVVSEAHFYTNKGQDFLMSDEQFNSNTQNLAENRKRFTNLLVFASDHTR